MAASTPASASRSRSPLVRSTSKYLTDIPPSSSSFRRGAAGLTVTWAAADALEAVTTSDAYANLVLPKLLRERGCKIVAVSDVTGGYYNEQGLDIAEMQNYAAANGNLLEGYANAQKISNDELLTLDVDVLVPAAREDQITKYVAERVRAKIIAEGANGPTTPEADAILNENGVLVVPDILANAGGVTVSYFEWVQDRQGYFWTLDRVNRRLDRMMTAAFQTVFDEAQKHDVSMRIGAYVLAIHKVATALKLRGIYA